MPLAQLGTMTLMEEWELVEDVPEDMGADITHNNALSSIRGILSKYDIPGHYSPISTGAMMSTHDDVWHTIAIEQSEKSEEPDMCELSNLHCQVISRMPPGRPIGQGCAAANNENSKARGDLAPDDYELVEDDELVINLSRGIPQFLTSAKPEEDGPMTVGDFALLDPVQTKLRMQEEMTLKATNELERAMATIRSLQAKLESGGLALNHGAEPRIEAAQNMIGGSPQKVDVRAFEATNRGESWRRADRQAPGGSGSQNMGAEIGQPESARISGIPNFVAPTFVHQANPGNDSDSLSFSVTSAGQDLAGEVRSREQACQRASLRQRPWFLWSERWTRQP